MEKLIKAAINPHVMDPDFRFERQFGCKSFKNTEDAVVTLPELITKAEENMVLAILCDMTGAFDNIRWSTILDELSKTECEGHLYRLISSYLKGRHVRIEEDFNIVEKEVFKGSIQGSVLGPDLWNISLDDILKKLEDMGCIVIAYADDIVVVIKRSSRRKLNQKSQPIVDVLDKWCEEQELQISRKKTEMLILKSSRKGEIGTVKGSLVTTGKGGLRPPIIKLGNTSIHYSETVRYLGVYFGTNFNITEHIGIAVSKGKTIFNKLCAIARTKWGVSFSGLRVIYNGVFVPTVLYGVGWWGERLNVHHRKTLVSSQRFALIKIARAYRTCSTEALQALCGVIPIDLLVDEYCHRYKIIIGAPFTYHELEYDLVVVPKVAKNKLRNIIKRLWQERWSNSEKGRTTYGFIPEIERSLSHRLSSNLYTTQFFTGHGDFNYKLKQFNLSDDDRCSCAEVETSWHVLTQCNNYIEIRQGFIEDSTVQKYY